MCWAAQGVDWRDPRAHGCNAGRNPIQESFYDGVNADPLEVLFVKIKAFQLDSNWVSTRLATTYARWAQDQVGPPATHACTQPTHLPAGTLTSSTKF